MTDRLRQWRQVGDRAAERRRPVWWTTFVAVFAMTGLWSLASPLSSGPDEPNHLAYAAAIWNGDPFATDVVPGDPGFPPGRLGVARHLSESTVPVWVVNAMTQPDCFAFHPQVPATCSPDLGDSTASTTVYHTFGRYPPTYYVLVGWPTAFLSGDTAYHAVRLVSAALCAALAASAMTSAVSLAGRRRVTALGVGLALTPLAVFLFGTVTSSALEIVAGLLLWVAGLDLLSRRGAPPTRLVVRAATGAVLLAWSRPGGFAYCAAIGVVLLIATVDRDRARELLRTRATQVGLGVVAGALAVGAVWLVVRKPGLALLGLPMPDVSATEAARHSLSLLPQRGEQMVGVLGWLDTPLPRWTWLGWLALVAVAVTAALVVGRNRERAAVVLAAVIVVVVPLVLEVQAVKDVGYVWQGRYTLPLAVGLPVLATWIVSQRAGERFDRTLGVAAVVTTAFVVVVQLIAHARGLDRYVAGLEGPLFDYLDDEGWRPPLGRKGQLVASLAVSALWAAVLGWLSLGHRPADRVGGADAGRVGAAPTSGARTSAAGDAVATPDQLTG